MTFNRTATANRVIRVIVFLFILSDDDQKHKGKASQVDVYSSSFGELNFEDEGAISV